MVTMGSVGHQEKSACLSLLRGGVALGKAAIQNCPQQVCCHSSVFRVIRLLQFLIYLGVSLLPYFVFSNLLFGLFFFSFSYFKLTVFLKKFHFPHYFVSYTFSYYLEITN